MGYFQMRGTLKAIPQDQSSAVSTLTAAQVAMVFEGVQWSGKSIKWEDEVNNVELESADDLIHSFNQMSMHGRCLYSDLNHE